MRDANPLLLALGLTPPWSVTGSDFDPESYRLDIQIDFTPGSRFACPQCGAADFLPHDTERMTWCHLNFFQHQAHVHARVPRVRCGTSGFHKVHVFTGSGPVAGCGRGLPAASPCCSRRC